MATYIPPTEDLPVFDRDVFITSTDNLTIADADLRYLRYPIAQGTETIASLNTGGVLQITSNGTLGTKILNTQTGSATNPAASGRTDFFNEDTTGTEVNSAMIDYSGFHTATLNSLPDQASSALSICPNSARAAAVNIATGANNTSGCIVNIANGTGTNSSIIRMGKNNLINIDSATSAVNISGVPIKLNNSATGDVGIGFSGAGGSNIFDVNNGTNSTGPINIGNGGGTSAQLVRIGRNNALTLTNSSGTTQIDLIGGLRLNATGSVGNTFTLASQSNASGAIEIANGTNGLANVSICSGSTNNGVLNLGNCGGGSGTINLGANGGSGLIQIGSVGRAVDFRGATISMFPTTFQITGTNFTIGSGTTTLFNGGGITLGDSAQSTSLISVRQNTAGLVAGNLGFTTRTTISTFTFPSTPGNTFYQMATIVAPAYQVSLISVSCSWTNNDGIAATKFGAGVYDFVSTTITNATPTIGAGFQFWQENDTQNNAFLQSVETLSGVYVNTTASAVNLYVYACYNQVWTTNAPTFNGSTSITKIG